MGRSLKKPPFVHYKLQKRVETMQSSGKKSVIKTWSRASMITPEFVGLTIAVHNGNKFIPVYVTENMVGHKLGEFSVTRTFRAHSGHRKEEKSPAGVPGGSSATAAPAAAPAADKKE